jgi:predicted MFS family arabinose efflux permease
VSQHRPSLIRTPETWLVYLLLSLYVYMLNLPGPITGYLRQEFQLTYTESSLHFSAFAAGVLVTGLLAGPLIRKLAPWRVMAIGSLGLGVGGLILTWGRQPALTIFGLFLMGCLGTWILSMYPLILEQEMGNLSSVGITEANTIGSIFAAAAPLLVGALASQAVGWRMAILAAAAISLALGVWLWLRTREAQQKQIVVPVEGEPQASDKLPGRYWLIWLALMFGVAIEFCTIYWSADFNAKVLDLPQNAATQAVSLFLIGMILGRFAGSRLIVRWSARIMLLTSLILGMAGFAAFWSGAQIALSLAGLFVMGLGVANFYTTLLPLALKAAGGQKQLAGARATLATGVAIFFLPFGLGALADGFGIQTAFLLVAILFVLVVLMLVLAAPFKLNDLKNLLIPRQNSPQFGVELAKGLHDSIGNDSGE